MFGEFGSYCNGSYSTAESGVDECVDSNGNRKARTPATCRTITTADIEIGTNVVRVPTLLQYSPDSTVARVSKAVFTTGVEDLRLYMVVGLQKSDNTELVHQTNGAYIDFNLIASDGTFMKSARQIEDGNTLGFSMSELLTAAGLPKDSLLATANLQGIVGMNASRSPPYRVTGILLAVDFWCSNIRPNTFEWSSQDKYTCQIKVNKMREAWGFFGWHTDPKDPNQQVGRTGISITMSITGQIGELSESALVLLVIETVFMLSSVRYAVKLWATRVSKDHQFYRNAFRETFHMSQRGIEGVGSMQMQEQGSSVLRNKDGRTKGVMTDPIPSAPLAYDYRTPWLGPVLPTQISTPADET